MLTLAACGLPAAAQVVLNPNIIEGTLSFTNTNPAIVSLLGSPGDLGIFGAEMFANSLPPAPSLQEISSFTLPVGGLTGSYQITVESAKPGIVYSVAPEAEPNNAKDLYYFAPLISPPVLSNAPPVTMNFSECVTVVNFTFVNAADVPVNVSVGKITAAIPGAGVQAESDLGPNTLSPAAANRYFVIRGGTNYTLDIQYDVGTNLYADEVQYELVTNVTAVADQILPIKCVVPAAATTGKITGNLAMTGEFVLSIPGDLPFYPAYPLMVAENGPFGNLRWDTPSAAAPMLLSSPIN